MDEYRRVTLRILSKAVAKAGGLPEAALLLRVPVERLEMYILGDEIPPSDIFLRAVEFMIDDDPAALWADTKQPRPPLQKP